MMKDRPGGDEVDDGADVEAQSLEQHVWLTSSSLGVLTSSDDGDEILSDKFFTLFGLK
jgi:hypothetical protein